MIIMGRRMLDIFITISLTLPNSPIFLNILFKYSAANEGWPVDHNYSEIEYISYN